MEARSSLPGGGAGCFLIDEMHCAGQLRKPKRENRIAGTGGGWKKASAGDLVFTKVKESRWIQNLMLLSVAEDVVP